MNTAVKPMSQERDYKIIVEKDVKIPLRYRIEEFLL